MSQRMGQPSVSSQSTSWSVSKSVSQPVGRSASPPISWLAIQTTGASFSHQWGWHIMSNTFASASISNISIVTFTVERSLCIYTLGVYCTVSKLCRTFVLVYKEERKVRAKKLAKWRQLPRIRQNPSKLKQHRISTIEYIFVILFMSFKRVLRIHNKRTVIG